MADFKFPVVRKSKDFEHEEPVTLVDRSDGSDTHFFTGPVLPHIMKNAPHQDIGYLLDSFVGDLQGIGGKICDGLDKPLEKMHLKFPGPHRWVDDQLTTGTGIVRYLIGERNR